MRRNARRTTAIITVAVLLLALAVGGGIWLARSGGDEPQAAPGATAPPATVAPGTTTAPTQKVMTVKVYFHERAPSAESDPRRVAPVARTVPRAPKVATAALTELLRGPSARERAAGFWSFFSADTAGTLRSVRIDAGTAFADFRDFRRVIPNASSSFGSAALLAELDTTLGQFSTVKLTLYAIDGNVAAFYEWLQLAPPAWATTGTWRSIATAPIAGRDGAAAVWTGHRLLIWGGRDARGALGDGAAYDPRSNRWDPIARQSPATVRGAAWTGTRMLVWTAGSGGATGGTLYDPVRDRWTPIARGPALSASGNDSGPVWTESELVAWAGGIRSRGIAYAPATDRWSVLPRGPLASGDRVGAAMVWTGREVVIWSGWSTAAAAPPYRDGAAYQPATGF